MGIFHGAYGQVFEEYFAFHSEGEELPVTGFFIFLILPQLKQTMSILEYDFKLFVSLTLIESSLVESFASFISLRLINLVMRHLESSNKSSERNGTIG